MRTRVSPGSDSGAARLHSGSPLTYAVAAMKHALTLVALLVVSCGAESPQDTAAPVQSGPLDGAFADAAREFQVPVEVLNWRITASAPASSSPTLDRSSKGPQSGHGTGRRRVHLWQENQEVPVMPRAALAPGAGVTGPVILEEADTTLVIPPGWTAALGEMGAVVATRD